MTITKDHAGGLLFLCFSLLYGYYTREIALFPGDEFEPFTARSMPTVLAGLGIVLSFLQLITVKRQPQSGQNPWAGIQYTQAVQLLVLMLVFSLALPWVGFLIATIGFLIAGYRILGERRPRILLIASVPFALGFWVLLTQLLDIYLAPGWLAEQFMGGV
ncbi:Tripartite tricarboxylate transporter TctB family protein [Vibrio aerogenes CECT 7868]|uniref:Tripartite tricarboxylate transporter TctB family protein n=1 Tax=Vibrio aerogenes CECT 7868 TaxID=1216006 RepID=A0A1M5Y556_9VIBR|nr:tripartite tricarboxylate transporter TctB family protein [Vibrio aerogenes]SHI07225.1 Tripartite tricarboxylate transporter TctB family protein [Vibrio aerogenes CECT 7868]